MTTPPLRNVLERLLQWDHFDAAADGAFWRREITAALAAPLPAPNWQPVPPRARIKPTHEAADAFWKYWRENGETHKHGYYESTWGAINKALAHGWDAAAAPLPQPPELTRYSEMTREQLERHAERMAQALADDKPRIFWERHARSSPLAAPSCFVCGRLPEKVAIWHGDLPGVVVCAKCRDGARGTESDLTARPALTDEQIDKIQSQAYQDLVLAGYNGGMGGQQWDRASARAIERAILGNPTPIEARPVPTPSVPEGWKLVPMRATQAMLEAAAPFPEHLRTEHPDPLDVWHSNMLAATLADQAVAASTYRTMLGAAPQAPEPGEA